MHSDLAYSPAQYSAFFGLVTACVAVVTGTVAVVSFLALRRDSRDRSRPVMSADLRPRILSPGLCELVVANVGPTAARNVQVNFDPPIPAQDGTVAKYVHDRYKTPFATVAPGREFINIFAKFVGDGTSATDEDVPHDFAVTFTYADTHGRQYRDKYQLSLDLILHQTRSNPSNTDDDGMKLRLINALEHMARGVGKI